MICNLRDFLGGYKFIAIAKVSSKSILLEMSPNRSNAWKLKKNTFINKEKIEAWKINMKKHYLAG